MASCMATTTENILGTRDNRAADSKHLTDFEKSTLASPVQPGARAYGHGVLYQAPKQLGAPAAHLKLETGQELTKEQQAVKEFFSVSIRFYLYQVFMGAHGCHSQSRSMLLVYSNDQLRNEFKIGHITSVNSQIFRVLDMEAITSGRPGK